MTIKNDEQGYSEELSLLRFRTRSLPEGARYTNAVLRIVCEETISKADQEIRVFSVLGTDWNQKKLDGLKKKPPPKTSEIGIKDIFGSGSGFFGTGYFGKNPAKGKAASLTSEPSKAAKALKVETDENGEKLISLVLWPVGAGSRRWYSISPQIDSANQPRLILKYTVQPSPHPVFQSDGLPAVRSTRAFVPKENPSVQNSYVSRQVVSGWSYAPAFYNNLVYTLTERNSQKYLNALSPLGARIWSVAIPAPPADAPKDPGQHLAVSNSGRLYIVGNQRIIVFQLDPNNPTLKPTVLHNLSVPDLNPDVPLTVGPDGSLYFVNGMEVYGLNPDLQELWKMTLKDKTSSRVTVGPSGQFVYLTAKNEGLVAINAQTGEITVPSSDKPGQKALNNTNNLTFHAPVVIRHPDGTEKIYAGANSADSGVLACFDNFKTNPDNGLAKDEIKQAWKIEGLFSQPSLDPIQPDSSKKLYSVKVKEYKGKQFLRGTLIAIDWLSGNETSWDRHFPVGSSSPYLLNGGNLALDKDGHVFIWNGDGGQSNLYGFQSSLSRIFDAVISDFPPESQLLFGTDGTLYANDVKGRILRAILPEYKLGEETGDTNIHSPTHLRVDGTAGGNKQWTLSAGGSVILGKKCTVKKGTIFRIRRKK
jgi:hypothetical protein